MITKASRKDLCILELARPSEDNSSCDKAIPAEQRRLLGGNAGCKWRCGRADALTRNLFCPIDLIGKGKVLDRPLVAGSRRLPLGVSRSINDFLGTTIVLSMCSRRGKNPLVVPLAEPLSARHLLPAYS